MDLKISIDDEVYNHFLNNNYTRDDVMAIHAALNNAEPNINDGRWCNTCEFKHLESECLGCAVYDENDNLINLRNYKKEEEK